MPSSKCVQIKAEVRAMVPSWEQFMHPMNHTPPWIISVGHFSAMKKAIPVMGAPCLRSKYSAHRYWWITSGTSFANYLNAWVGAKVIEKITGIKIRYVYLNTFPRFSGDLTHWGRVTHICVSNIIIIDYKWLVAWSARSRSLNQC